VPIIKLIPSGEHLGTTNEAYALRMCNLYLTFVDTGMSKPSLNCSLVQNHGILHVIALHTDAAITGSSFVEHTLYKSFCQKFNEVTATNSVGTRHYFQWKGVQGYSSSRKGKELPLHMLSPIPSLKKKKISSGKQLCIL